MRVIRIVPSSLLSPPWLATHDRRMHVTLTQLRTRLYDFLWGHELFSVLNKVNWCRTAAQLVGSNVTIALHSDFAGQSTRCHM